MFASIHSVSDENYHTSLGKTLKVSSPFFDIALKTGKSDGVEGSKHLEIDLKDNETISSGKRTGVEKMIDRHLTLRLDKSDLQKIFEQAFAAGLVEIPGLSEIIAASESLSKAAAKMQPAKT